MKVYFIGAGPGAADLMTVRGAAILKKSPLVLYAGSLVDKAVLDYCSPDTEIVDTASTDLEEQVALYRRAKAENLDVARVHSGDPAIYGATAEQMRRLEEMDIAYEVVPGVSSFTASAACVQAELTKPLISQSIILTRASGRASAVPEKESIGSLAVHQTTMCIFLSGPHLPKIVEELKEHYPADTPIVLVYKATWPQERIHWSNLENVVDEVKVQDWALSTMMLVGPVLGSELIEESKLYASHYSHKFRTGTKKTDTTEKEPA